VNKLYIGAKFRLTQEAREGYGLPDRMYRVRSWANEYVPSAAYFKNPAAYPHGHPGYDDSVKGQRLYEADGLNCAVYDWEVVAA
jgi:hypothetical protein